MYTTLLLAVSLCVGCGAGSCGGASSDGAAVAAMRKSRPTATVYDRERSVTLRDTYIQNAEAQFPDAMSIEVVEEFPYARVPEAFRQRADQSGQIRLTRFREGLAQSVMGSSFVQNLGARFDAAIVLCSITLKNGLRLIHALNACFFILDVRMQEGTRRTIDRRMWEVMGLTTYTASDQKGLEQVILEMQLLR